MDSSCSFASASSVLPSRTSFSISSSAPCMSCSRPSPERLGVEVLVADALARARPCAASARSMRLRSAADLLEHLLAGVRVARSALELLDQLGQLAALPRQLLRQLLQRPPASAGRAATPGRGRPSPGRRSPPAPPGSAAHPCPAPCAGRRRRQSLRESAVARTRAATSCPTCCSAETRASVRLALAGQRPGGARDVPGEREPLGVHRLRARTLSSDFLPSRSGPSIRVARWASSRSHSSLARRSASRRCSAAL